MNNDGWKSLLTQLGIMFQHLSGQMFFEGIAAGFLWLWWRVWFRGTDSERLRFALWWTLDLFGWTDPDWPWAPFKWLPHGTVSGQRFDIDQWRKAQPHNGDNMKQVKTFLLQVTPSNLHLHCTSRNQDFLSLPIVPSAFVESNVRQRSCLLYEMDRKRYEHPWNIIHI